MTNLPVFILASLGLLLIPGPAVLYIVARSIDQGRRAGLISVASIEIGNFCHVIAATLGLSALVLSSATTFSVIKYLGAAYLVYLGIRRLTSREEAGLVLAPGEEKRNPVFFQGVVVAVLNPKTALFFLAFLPQFVNVSHGSVTWQLFILGVIFVSMAIVTDSLYALLAGTAKQWLKGNMHLIRGERYVAGCIYIGLGILAATSNIAKK